MGGRPLAIVALAACAGSACLDAPPPSVAPGPDAGAPEPKLDADPDSTAGLTDAASLDGFLVAHFPFDDSFEPVVGEGAGTCSGVTCPDFVDGRVAIGLEFKGSERLEIPNPTALQLAEGTAAIWVFNKSVYGSTEGVVGVTLGAETANSWEIFIGYEENARFASDGGPTVDGPAIPRDEWFHVAVTWSADARSLVLNGTILIQDTASASPAYDAQPIVVGTGIDDGMAANSFTGIVDDLRIYDRALDEDEIGTIVAGAP